ncbi:MAG: hypothetical protein KDI19_02985, partial [Pseudomonadales bacterium]|nr:hypothetical protein [Pseudomonadales bacterium]
LYWSSQITKGDAYSEQLADSSRKRDTLTATLEALGREIEADPNNILRLQNSQLETQIASQEDELHGVVAQLVRPREMVDLLQQVLKQSRGVELIELENLAVEQVFGDGNADADGATISLYRHQVRMVFSAEYFDTLGYLQNLESLGARLIFRRLDYKVDEYPRARVELIVETLGMDKEWLGV